MKTPANLPFLLLASSALLLMGCATGSRKQPPAAPVSAPVGKARSDGKTVQKTDGKSVAAAEDDLDTYSAPPVSDPLEPLNRVTFQLNDGIYTIVLRPISKVYETVLPKPVRQGIYNAFENVRFPIRLVNDLLQAKFPRAGQETGKFLVNTVAGVGGIGRPSDHIPALADVPAEDTGQTFGKWGIGTGPYLVLPILGPSTVRDTVGLAGDYALNPITWVSFIYGDYDWIIAIPATNTARALPVQLGIYDSITKDALDRYLAARSAYLQNRKEAISK